ncbi:ArsR/SmtB family transcription factor [Corynebacterium atrinae]|uniref:ArsR/SmtB family transcription factor n=1 Tax=Corynebacterium atrinae TaxID=1336740 RepID=UPI0025B5ED11|nr:metalloregulator ArsR/SmtB family transcription factor [Corynebacterium atrinae]
MNPLSDSDLAAAELVIGALDSRLRLQIIQRLSEREHFVHELVAGLGKSQPLISQHLRVLKRSGIVNSERRGREVIYRLAAPGADDLIMAAIELHNEAPTEVAAGQVINIHRGTEPEGDAGTGQIAHAPAAALPGEPTLDPIPDPAPVPPTPQSFS